MRLRFLIPYERGRVVHVTRSAPRLDQVVGHSRAQRSRRAWCPAAAKIYRPRFVSAAILRFMYQRLLARSIAPPRPTRPFRLRSWRPIQEKETRTLFARGSEKKRWFPWHLLDF